MEENKPKIIQATPEKVSYDVQLRDFENGLQDFLFQHNLPSENIFVGIPERVNA